MSTAHHAAAVPTTTGATPRAAMSIDVEDWYTAQNLAAGVPRDSWDTQPRRVEHTMGRMLDIMAEKGVRSTCFILGLVAERHPALIKRIAAEGHEIASHGTMHDLIYDIGPERFREDIRRSKQTLEDLTGQRVDGYRAPCFSITDFALDILREEGFTYDTSVFPIKGHRRYGTIAGQRTDCDIYEIRPGLMEVNVSSMPICGKQFPWAGGAYFRLYPYAMFRAGVRRILASGRPYVFYTHPWEIDWEHPRPAGVRMDDVFRHYHNMHKSQARWTRLLGDVEWTTCRELIASGIGRTR